MQQDVHYAPGPQAHPGLHLIALFELAKGLVSGGTVIALAAFGPQPTRDLTAKIGALLHFDPQQSAMASVLALITQRPYTWRSAYTRRCASRCSVAYGARGAWFGAIATTTYLPFCSYAAWRHPRWPTVAVLALNIMIVSLLARDLYKRRVGANA